MILDSLHHRYWPTWHAFVAKLADEVDAARSEGAAVGFDRLMDVHRMLRQKGRVREPVLLEELFESLSVELSCCLQALKEERGGSLAERLHAALGHEDLHVADLPSDTFEGISERDALSLLERFAPIVLDSRVGKDRRWLLTRLASKVELDTLVRTADRLGLWRALDPVCAVWWFLANGRWQSPFASLAVRAVVEADQATDRAALLDECLALCEACDQPHVAQDIRLSLFDETLGVPFAREWLSNLPRAADQRLQQAHIFHRVRRSKSRGKALLFFIDWPDLGQALDIASALPPTLPDLDPWQLRRASQALEECAPQASLSLLRQACGDATDYLGRHGYGPNPAPREPMWFAKWPSSTHSG